MDSDGLIAFFAKNGSVDKRQLLERHCYEWRQDYSDFEFMPFESINEVVKLYGRAVQVFARNIVSHFNDKYGVSVPMGTLPTYQTHVDSVIAHLGGKDFRATAEEELIARFNNVVDPGLRGKFEAELKENKNRHSRRVVVQQSDV